MGMGNFLIYVALSLFTLFWVYVADTLCFQLLRKCKIVGRFSEKTAWVWGLILITLGLLGAFAVMGVSLARVLSGLFENAAEVSQKGIAVGILLSLCTSWLLSLRRFGDLIANFYADQDSKEL
jgi:hypothetical protein